MKTKIIRNILQQTAVVNKLYKKIFQLSGENFNVFKIIGLTSNEVRVHSAFIAELLNPKGSHEQGAIFLDLFIKELNLLDLGLNSNEAKIEIEKSIGVKTENKGGRIDIYISDNSGKSIIIENKIYANDQENQLIRYDTFAKSSRKPYKLLYLTLEGKDASKKSTGDTEINYSSISYKNEITQWLETCQKEVGRQLVVREGIVQYTNLIKYLTNQTSSQAMEKEIESILKESSENIESAMLISNSLENVKVDILNNFWDSMKKEFKERNLEIDKTREIDLKKRTRAFIINSSRYVEGLRIIIKEENSYRYYWGDDILDSTFISGFYIRRYENLEEALPTSENDLETFVKQQNELYECGFNYSNKWWLAYKLEKELNFKSFTSTVCSFVEEGCMQECIEKIISDVIKGVEIFKNPKTL